MKKGKSGHWIISALLILITGLSAGRVSGSGAGKQLPFRVLVIIGDQWKDPASYAVEMPEPTGEYSGYALKPEVHGDNDFHHLVVLLKAWGIPFDVVRLDQQYLDRYMFLDMQERAKYGTIIWDVNMPDNLLPQNYQIISDIVNDYGIGLVAISDRIGQREIQDLLGIRYNGSWESNSELVTKADHFITRGLASPFRPDSLIPEHRQRQQAELLPGTLAIVSQGPFPQVTVKESQSGAHTVWIGNDHNALFYFRDMRTILRKAITWTIGYSVFRTWENEMIMIMDDPGGASSSWLEHWHYPTLTEDTIEKFMIDPLIKNKAVLNINFVPGFVNDKLKRLEPSWEQDYTDEFGTRQNFVSGKRGYDKGVKLGVFTVMSHGLTHMQPDLSSDPAWYGSKLDMERSEVGWYREFGDTRRLKEIPPAEQKWRMEQSAEWLKEQFGVAPLEFCPGGLGTSFSYFCNTARLAGEAGYGWYGWEGGYLGKDMVINEWKFFGSADSPLIIPVPPDGHDFGIARSPELFAGVFRKYPGKRFISINEFIGYLHSEILVSPDRKKDQIDLVLEYDSHYCQFFDDHSSVWNLEFSDWFTDRNGKISSVIIDRKNAEIRAGRIEIPKGTGIHRIELKF